MEGNIRTELQRNLPSLATKIMVRLAILAKTLVSYLHLFWTLQNAVMLYPTPMGAITQLWAGTSPEAVNLNGKYLVPWAREGPVRPETRDAALGEKLWTWLEGQVKDL